MTRGLLLLTVLFAWACQPSNPQSPATQAMVSHLQAKADTAYQSGSYPYFTDKMLEKLGRGINQIPPRMRASKVLDYALVLVLKGDNAPAIDQIETQLKSLNNFDEVNRYNNDFFRVLALAYLREAEQQNCIDHHGNQSCIVPLDGDGIHHMKAPAEEAKKYYEKLLLYDSTDYQSRWFYNLSHMATGTYPDAVNPTFLLVPALFDSEIDFPYFPNRAMACGVATNNHAGGSSLIDINNDGLLDIFTTAYSLGDPAHLFLNNGKGSFDDITEEAGLKGLTGGLNHIHADFNNDGLTDIFIMRGAWLADNGHIPNSLLINQGDNRFEDETEARGLLNYKPTGAVSTADFDLDGDLDIFVGNESSKDRNASAFYVNTGDGHFENKAAELGLEQYTFVKGATWGDVNKDGLPDLFVSNYGAPNKLFINRGGRFEEAANQAGVSAPDYSFTTWFWDYDQDGWQDLLVFGYDNRKAYMIADEICKEMLGLPTAGEYPRLYRNNGDETFTDLTDSVGLDKLIYAMGGNFGDLDNDGFPDFYAGTGEFNIWATVPNRMFHNNQGKAFQEVTTAGGFGMIQKGHGVSFGDIDNDGDQDIYHQVGGAAESDVFHNMLFENPGFGNNWITLKLVGTTSNRSAIGARIAVHLSTPSGSKTHYHTVNTGGSFGANSLQAEIGLGEAQGIDSVKISWPTQAQIEQVFYKLELNHSYTITEGMSLPEKIKMKSFTLHTTGGHH